jgi:hypothetical protein
MSSDITRSEMKVYRAWRWSTRAVILLFPPTLIAATVGWTATDRTLASPRAIRGVVLGLALVLGYVLYRVAHTVVLHDDLASIEFRSFVGSRVVRVTDIRSVVPSWRGELVVEHAHGVNRMPSEFPGVDEVLAWIRRSRPGVSFGGILDR